MFIELAALVWWYVQDSLEHADPMPHVCCCHTSGFCIPVASTLCTANQPYTSSVELLKLGKRYVLLLLSTPQLLRTLASQK